MALNSKKSSRHEIYDFNFCHLLGDNSLIALAKHSKLLKKIQFGKTKPKPLESKKMKNLVAQVN